MTALYNNSLFADHFVQYLIDLGVKDFCIAPGSRSTPLVSAVARHPQAKTYIFYDERCAAFFALGLGKGKKVRVNEENSAYVQDVKATIMETFGEIYAYYGS